VSQIQCPTCPLCGSQPAFTLPGLTPWFCSNDDCNVLGWDPYSTLDENLLDAGRARIFIDGVEQPPDSAGS
jgi:hypothetical protein